MNLILLEPENLLSESRALLSGIHHHHVVDVLKAKVGDTLKVGLLDGQKGLATIQHTGLTDTAIEYLVDQQPPKKLPLHIILALPRPKVIRRILRSCAEFGVSEITLLNSYKVEKSYWQSPQLQPSKVHRHFLDGLEQSGDTILPALNVEPRFKPFAEDRLPNIVQGKNAFVCHPYVNTAMPVLGNKQSVIAIGPEGGFTKYELEKLQEAGMQAVSIGDRILRSENALIKAISSSSP